MFKLQSLGVGRFVLGLLQDFLNGRQQCGVVDGVLVDRDLILCFMLYLAQKTPIFTVQCQLAAMASGGEVCV